MTKPTDTEAIADLEVKSLQCDVLALRRDRELDRKEFTEFASSCAVNFAALTQNLASLNASFAKFFATQPEVEMEEDDSPDKHLPSGQGSTVHNNGPPTGAQDVEVIVDPNKQTRPHTAPAGVGRLFDHKGRELNLDSTPKATYKHPNAGSKPKD